MTLEKSLASKKPDNKHFYPIYGLPLHNGDTCKILRLILFSWVLLYLYVINGIVFFFWTGFLGQFLGGQFPISDN